MVETLQERKTVVSEIQTAIRHMAVYGLGGILAKGIGFLMLPFYTHYLTPADYGILEILDLSMSLFALVLSLGMIPAFMRCYAGAKTDDEKRRVVSTGMVFSVVTGAGIFLLGLNFIRPVTVLLFGPRVPSTYVLLSFSAIVLSYMANIPRSYLRALEASGAFTVVDTVYVLLLLTMNVIFIAGLKVGLVGVLWSSAIAATVQIVGLGGWACYRAGIRFHWPHLSVMLKYGFPLIFANLGMFVLNFSDRFFLQHLRSIDAVGVYAVGYKFGYMMNYLVVQPFLIMWQARMYAIHSQPEHPRIFRQLFALFSMGLIYTGFLMSLYSREVIRMMVEPKFAASQNVIPVVVLAYIFYGLSYYTQLGLFLTDNTKMIGFIGAGSAVVNLVSNYLLISAYGMMGAAWATALSFAFMAGASYVCSLRVFPLRLGVSRMLLGMTVASGLYIGVRWLGPEGFVPSMLTKAVVALLFPVIVWKSGILAPSAAATILSAAQSAMGPVSRWRGVALAGQRSSNRVGRWD